MYYVGFIFLEIDMYVLFILIIVEYSELGNNKFNF